MLGGVSLFDHKEQRPRASAPVIASDECEAITPTRSDQTTALATEQSRPPSAGRQRARPRRTIPGRKMRIYRRVQAAGQAGRQPAEGAGRRCR